MHPILSHSPSIEIPVVKTAKIGFAIFTSYFVGSCIVRDKEEFNNISCLAPSCSLLEKIIILPPFDY